ncbi:hypothetical protein GCM10010191_64540 [Actinomadura vinacea]|uniref:GAF domain-containing protein n=2 Tax=Actinomadura vinacea TaxID=115336 RepID=A0ABP5WYF4_9ACTN
MVRAGGPWPSLDDDAADAHALHAAERALRQMSDGFLTLGGEGRIGYSNAAAERLLGPPHRLAGRRLWEVPVLRQIPDLEDRCRKVMADGAPIGIDVRRPDGERWYRLRLMPVEDGLALTITDVTEERWREAARRRATARESLMDELTGALAEAVDTQSVVTAIAASILPAFRASGLIITAAEGGRLQVIGAVGYSPETIDALSGTTYPADSPTDVALRTRTPQFFGSTAELLARHPDVAGYPRAPDKDARVFLPLITSGRPMGVGVVSFDGRHRFDEEERTLLTALSSVIAQALERARLYDVAATQARELQRGLLPHILPSLPAVTGAARYLPADDGADVGGDWYDIIPLSSDRVALVIGDVMGRGISEAATMGRLRTAVRTLSELDLPPDEVLDRLNDIVSDLGADYFATCLYGIYDPVTGDFTYASAGHPPPSIACPDGTVTTCTTVTNPPLGAASPPFDTTTANLPDGTLLLLYTDGLLESADRDADQGMTRLTQTLATTLQNAPDTSLEALCDILTAALLPSDQLTGDDAALLVSRTGRLPASNVATWPLPEDPRAAGMAREHVRDQLAAWHLDEELTMTTELLVSELVGNVVRHAKGPMRLRMLRSRTLICEVSDGSLTTPLIRRADLADEGGRGLQLVAALTQRWGTRYNAGGKSIWTEQNIPETEAPARLTAG